MVCIFCPIFTPIINDSDKWSCVCLAGGALTQHKHETWIHEAIVFNITWNLGTHFKIFHTVTHLMIHFYRKKRVQHWVKSKVFFEAFVSFMMGGEDPKIWISRRTFFLSCNFSLKYSFHDVWLAVLLWKIKVKRSKTKFLSLFISSGGHYNVSLVTSKEEEFGLYFPDIVYLEAKASWIILIFNLL